jgi:anti-sigma regulatory factor (Ser/Thr protein kinase)
VRWVSEASNVPAVRRFVAQSLADWGRADLLDDVALSATELAANAVIHSGSAYFEVELSADDAAVGLAVLHRGAMRARAVADRAEVAASTRAHDPQSMTGRGLFLVASMARSWGIDDVPGGIRMWAEFVPGTSEAVAGPPEVSGAPIPLDPDVGVIQLLGCPPDLLLAHDAHLADVAHELRLFAASHSDDGAAESARQVAEVVRLSAVSWDAARLLAKQAVAEGRPAVDVVTAPADVADLPRRIQVLRGAVARAESLMAQGLLMTAPASDEVQQWRDWVEGEMVEQTTAGREPIRFSDWVTARSRARLSR